jgi:molybdate transport system substrate-binding protein
VADAEDVQVGRGRIHPRDQRERDVKLRLRARWLAAAVVLAALVGVSAGPVGAESSSSATAAATPSGSITVSAAASLTEAFTTIGKLFQKKYKGTTVTFNFGSSGALELQIAQGAPADVFASADTDNMTKLQTAGKATPPAPIFARTRLVIVTKKGNPNKIKTIQDLANVQTLSLCALTVPCGKYAAQMFQTAGLTIPESKVTRGQDVKTTLAAVSPGDADAAVVYVSDAKTAGKTVSSVKIPDNVNVIALYPISDLNGSSNSTTANAFVKFVLSKPAQAVLRKDGFMPPPGKK